MNHSPPVYCEGPGIGPIAAVTAVLRGGTGVPRCPQFTLNALPCHQGRVGVALACSRFGIGPGDDVLLPAYHCGSEVDPILKAGATVTLYPVSRELRFDLSDIESRRSERTRAVYVIHYFGWPHDLTAIAAYCREHGLILIEDCALSMFSRTPSGQWVGRAGDAAIFSLPKTLPTPDGGILLLNSTTAAPCRTLSRSPSAAKIARRLLPLFKRSILRRTRERFGSNAETANDLAHSAPEPFPLADPLPDMPSSYYFDPSTSAWGMSRVTRGLVGTIDPEAIVTRRRANYVSLLNAIRNAPGVSALLPDLPPGVCPLGLPIHVDHRDWWLAALAVREISAFPWWAGYHRGLNWDDQPDAKFLKDHVLLLPVHQDLGSAHMDFVARQVITLAAAAPNRPSSPTPVEAAQ